MPNNFGPQQLGQATELVSDYISTVLYPTDTPEFVLQTMGVSMYPTSDSWMVFVESDLPDDILFQVVKTAESPGPVVFAYTRALESEPV